MNIDIPNLVKSTVPESEGRNVQIISNHSTNYRDPNFLSKDFPRSAPKLYLTAEDDEFDVLTIAEWREEGFDVEYIPMGDDRDEYRRKIRDLSRKKMAPCETFGIIGRPWDPPPPAWMRPPVDTRQHTATQQASASSTTTSWIITQSLSLGCSLPTTRRRSQTRKATSPAASRSSYISPPTRRSASSHSPRWSASRASGA